MEHIPAILSILAVTIVGMMSPGPSFVVMVRTSVGVSRKAGVLAALGMGGGSAIFCVLALLGLHTLLLQVPWLYAGLKIAGAAYLLYLAFQLWKGASSPLEISELTKPAPARRSKFFLLGLTTQLSNPKTAIVYSSIFVALLPAELPLWLGGVLLLSIFMLEAIWYSIVALIFSASGPRGVYLKLKCWIDRTAGSVLGLLGLRLIWDARG